MATRPQDTVKWLFLPAAFCVGALSIGSLQWTSFFHLIVVFVILEYLLYEARYQWNDIRGLAEDLSHPIHKGRLPAR